MTKKIITHKNAKEKKISYAAPTIRGIHIFSVHKLSL